MTLVRFRNSSRILETDMSSVLSLFPGLDGGSGESFDWPSCGWDEAGPVLGADVFGSAVADAHSCAPFVGVLDSWRLTTLLIHG